MLRVCARFVALRDQAVTVKRFHRRAAALFRPTSARHGFGETRVATLALPICTGIPECSCGIVTARFGGHSPSFRNSPTVFALNPMPGSTSTGVRSGKPASAMSSAAMLLGLYRMIIPSSFVPPARQACRQLSVAGSSLGQCFTIPRSIACLPPERLARCRGPHSRLLLLSRRDVCRPGGHTVAGLLVIIWTKQTQSRLMVPPTARPESGAACGAASATQGAD